RSVGYTERRIGCPPYEMRRRRREEEPRTARSGKSRPHLPKGNWTGPKNRGMVATWGGCSCAAGTLCRQIAWTGYSTSLAACWEGAPSGWRAPSRRRATETITGRRHGSWASSIREGALRWTADEWPPQTPRTPTDGSRQ